MLLNFTNLVNINYLATYPSLKLTAFNYTWPAFPQLLLTLNGEINLQSKRVSANYVGDFT